MKIPNVPAVDRFRKLVDDISRSLEDARRAQAQVGGISPRLRKAEKKKGPRMLMRGVPSAESNSTGNGRIGLDRLR